jgi:23S rRNA (guanosine2251-2'-O)-methyltransferase
MQEKVFGLHAVAALLDNAADRVQRLLVLDGRVDGPVQRLLARAETVGIPVERTSRRALDRAAGAGRHQGVLALCSEAMLASEAELELRWPLLPDPKLLLILDGVMDPRNLGACLRSASAAGASAVLLPKRRSAPLSDVARKTASGAAESLFIVSVSNLARRLEWLKAQGIWLVGAAGDARIAWSAIDFTKPVALVLGSEDKGMRALTRATCDELAAIPMTGPVTSLNVSVAAGVLLFEAVRQRAARDFASRPALARQ